MVMHARSPHDLYRIPLTASGSRVAGWTLAVNSRADAAEHRLRSAIEDPALAGEAAQLLGDALELLAQAHGLALERIVREIFVGERGGDLGPLERLVDAQDEQHLL